MFPIFSGQPGCEALWHTRALRGAAPQLPCSWATENTHRRSKGGKKLTTSPHPHLPEPQEPESVRCKRLHNHKQTAAFLHHYQWQQRSLLSCTLPKSDCFPFNFFCSFFPPNSTIFLDIKEYWRNISQCAAERLMLTFASTLLECRNISVHRLLSCIILSVGRAKSRICQWVNICIKLHLYVWNVGSAGFQLCHYVQQKRFFFNF